MCSGLGELWARVLAKELLDRTGRGGDTAHAPAPCLTACQLRWWCKRTRCLCICQTRGAALGSGSGKMGAESFKSWGVCGAASSVLGALTMFLFYMGMAKEYAFFGYEGSFSEAADACMRTLITFGALFVISLLAFVYGSLRKDSESESATYTAVS
ncbi:hypothetical protein FVE85_4245 [Porphyridium purpureum]|uniref:Uncharacterized protein n=1 Tax=Porphyridium purpureum TaxID=35688 RepID=A0A5J4YTL0_PORPP|nr:hypothetical protein FVE85_4245 [Porphyridium purpureum]|eukprot:POR7212..scf229_5